MNWICSAVALVGCLFVITAALVLALFLLGCGHDLDDPQAFGDSDEDWASNYYD